MTQKTGRFGASGREFCLCSLEKEDIEETLQLMDRCVGENLYQKEELEQAIGSSERAFLLLRTAEGELAGYIYYYLTNEKQIAEDTRLTEQKIQRVCQQDTLAPVGKIQSVGIKEAFRRQGLAVGLMKYALRQFAEKGIGEVFIICWNAGGKVPLERALQECRFVHLFSAKMIWYIKKNFIVHIAKDAASVMQRSILRKLRKGIANENKTSS